MQQRSNRYSRWLVTALGGALVLGSAACDKKDFNIVGLLASSITVSTASNNQVGVVGQPLAQPIVVHVTDADGASAVNALVSWTVVGSNGGSVSSATSTTDVDGNASVTWTLGQAAGLDSLIASITSGASVTITATATSAAAGTITKVSGDNQGLSVGQTSAPMVVLVVDQFGNPVANATVAWTTTGGGALSASSTTTDATGHSQVTLTTSATTGAFSVTASSGTAASVTFAGTNALGH